MKKQSLRISIMATPMMIIGTLLGAGAPANAQEAATFCSNRTLAGDYGFSIDGVILAGPSTLPLRGVAMTHFDGRGNLTQVDHVLVNGVPPALDWTPGSGPYTVNPDCTGTMQINVAGQPPLNLHIVVVKQGKEVHTVVGANAVGSIGIKLQ